MLKKVVTERTDPLTVEFSVKLSYFSCICVEEEKYHRDCMQQLLSIVTVISGPISYKHLISSNNYVFNNFCDWYESTSYDTTSPFTLFVVQKHIEDSSNNKELYLVRQLLENCRNAALLKETSYN